MKTFFSLCLQLLCCLLFLSLISCEDTIEPVAYGRISGQVIDIRNNQPVENATITTNPPTLSLITDAQGKFLINDAPTGNYAITVRRSGYKTESLSIQVAENSQTEARIVITPLNYTNASPEPVSGPVPADGASEQETILTLAWNPATDPDADTVRYDVYLFESDSLMGLPVLLDSYDTAVTVSDLRYNTTYYWQVLSKDSTNHITNGPIWSFKTLGYPFNRLFVSRLQNSNYEIYSAATDGTGPIRLTNNQYLDWRPLPAPRGESIAFAASQGTDIQLYTMSPEGADRFQLTDLPLAGYHNNGLGFTWSPNGNDLLYSHYERLLLISRNGTNLRTFVANTPTDTIAAERHWRELAWTAEDGGHIAGLTIGANPYQAEIYLLDKNGQNAKKLVANEPGGLGGLSFSVDGKQLLFTQDASGFESALGDGRQLDSRIYRINLASGERTDLSDGKEDGTNDLYPRYTPDGAQIVFVNVPNDNSAPPSVYIMDADGSNRTLLLENASTPAMR